MTDQMLLDGVDSGYYEWEIVLRDTPLVRKECASPYEMHRTLERLFAEAEHPYRWSRKNLTLYLRSREFPAWWDLPTGYAEQITIRPWRLNNTGVLEKVLEVRDDVETKVDALSIGTRKGFSLTANAVKTITTPTGRVSKTRKGKSKRVALRDPVDLLEWLHRQSAKSGFRVLGADVVNRKRNHLGENPKNITIESVEFQGVLEVRDPERLLTTLFEGLGKGKGFGLGYIHLE